MPRPRAKRRARQRERLLLRLLRGGLRVVLLVAALDLGRFFFIFASYDERSSFGLGGALILYLIIDGDGDGGLIYEPAAECETESLSQASVSIYASSRARPKVLFTA